MWWSSWLELLDTSPEQPLGFLTSSQGFIMAGCSFFTPLPSWVAPLLFLPALLEPPTLTSCHLVELVSKTGVFSCGGAVAEPLSTGLMQATCPLPPPSQWCPSPHLTFPCIFFLF